MDRYHNGTRNEVLKAKLDMLEIMDPFIRQRIKDTYPKYKKKDLGDYIQDARVAMLEGMKNHDSTKTAIEAYLKSCIDHEITTKRKTSIKIMEQVMLDSGINIVSENGSFK